MEGLEEEGEEKGGGEEDGGGWEDGKVGYWM